jgi:hypothetical protein
VIELILGSGRSAGKGDLLHPHTNAVGIGSLDSCAIHVADRNHTLEHSASASLGHLNSSKSRTAPGVGAVRPSTARVTENIRARVRIEQSITASFLRGTQITNVSRRRSLAGSLLGGQTVSAFDHFSSLRILIRLGYRYHGKVDRA